MTVIEKKLHQLSPKEALESLYSSENGLSDLQAQEAREKHGFNELKEKKKRSKIEMFLSQFDDVMVKILILAAIVSFATAIDYEKLPQIVIHTEEALDAGAIVAIVILNALFGFVQENRAEKAIDALKKMMAPVARVVRNGTQTQMPAKELVPGDVVVIEEGDKVPADCRLLWSKNVESEQSALTGESMPVGKNFEAMKEDNAQAAADQNNILFMGTTVTRGHGKAVVAFTGMNTQMGRISQLVSEQEEEDTPLQKRLEGLGKTLGFAALAIVLVVFATGILQGRQLMEMFLVGVSLAVAAIPEGLPAVVTIALAFGVQRMAKKNAIIRRLPAVETLGSATVICSDKTGTLTRNEMTVRNIYANGKLYTVDGKGYNVDGKITDEKGNMIKEKNLKENKALDLLFKTAMLCNNAKLLCDSEKEDCEIVGDPTEGALIVAATKTGLDDKKLRKEYEFVDEVPFDSARKMMSVAVKTQKGKILLLTKGAPEVILANSTKTLEGNREKQLTENYRKKILSENEKLASKAMRVMALAYKPATGKSFSEKNEKHLVFLGLAAMNDPPRTEAKDSVEVCKNAGIKVVMITGDNEVTAAAIAHEIGVVDGKKSRVVTGKELDSITDKELEKLSESIAVYARVNPEHKMKIVHALKKRGHVVAMTGDGVNDAPALKRADIGIAMGITGTDVAKESSEMVLTDDNFSSIVSAIEEGRVIYDNIIKSVAFLVSCNIGELLTIFFALIIGFPLPLLPLQILWMNLVTDGLPALALASEPAEPSLMKRKPRNSREKIISKQRGLKMLAVGMIMSIITLGVFALELENSGDETLARTMAFTTIIALQLVYAFASRSENASLFSLGVFKNKFLTIAVATSMALHLLIVYFEPAQEIFKTTALPIENLVILILASLSILAFSELRKKLWKIQESTAQTA
ncbi:MAG: calcium-translocating P-type ATPase, SERCA-type [Candidatus Micrarchaeia archaeon]